METIPSNSDSEFLANAIRGDLEAVLSRAVRPAEGERRAVAGFHAQYLISASLIYRPLRDRTLLWIRVADPDAGRVDDLQIGSQARIGAYQIKSGLYGGNFTFHELTNRANGDSSLLGDLASGWKSLKSLRPNERVVVHLVTNRTPSTSASLPSGGDAPVPNNFAAFLEQAWQPAHRYHSDKEIVVPIEWQTAWKAMLTSSGLSEAEFFSFVRDCQLEFGFQTGAGEYTSDSERRVIEEDLESIANALSSTVADPKRIVELDRRQLISRLGWQNRFEFVSRHEFPVNEVLYKPIRSTVGRLEQCLDNSSGGY